MACSRCNQSAPNTKCGCQDQPITAAFNPTPNASCPDPTPCYETIQDTCVKHSTQYGIYYFGTCISDYGYYPALPAGASLENAYQAMSVRAWDINCLPPLNVHPTYVGTTTIILNWELTGADYYVVEYGTSPGILIPTSNLTTNSYTFTLLNPNTTYYFQVKTNCVDVGASSTGALIVIKTL